MSEVRLLIVEDEPLVAIEMEETLQRAGFVVTGTVDSADLLISSVQDQKPDLILMDVRLKSFSDGIDAVGRLRLFSQIPVIYLTAFSTSDVTTRAEKTKPAAFLVKPVDNQLLIQTIKTTLNLD